jgi:hypothetical protein
MGIIPIASGSVRKALTLFVMSAAIALLTSCFKEQEETPNFRPKDLSAVGTSNSYIIKEGNKSYEFDATVRGNGVVATSSFPSITTTIATNNAYTASVLWSMGGTGATADGVVKEVAYKDGRISFKSADTTTGGNAVIALKNGSEVLWSWHIWMNTAYNADDDQVYDTGNYYGGTVTMMPYNLGAVNTTNTAVAAHAFDDGLLYQWGRKDPFLGGVEYTTHNDGGIHFYDFYDGGEFNYGTNPTEGTHYYADTDFHYEGSYGTPDLAYQNPTVLYLGWSCDDGTYDWTTTRYDNLWGNGSDAYAGWDNIFSNSVFGTKTLFDPCPPGYKVAPRNTWSSGTFENFANNGRTYKYGGTAATSFYPASGYRWSYIRPVCVGLNGSCWSSSPSMGDYRQSGALHFDCSLVYPLNLSSARANGYPVRCAREE